MTGMANNNGQTKSYKGLACVKIIDTKQAIVEQERTKYLPDILSSDIKENQRKANQKNQAGSYIATFPDGTTETFSNFKPFAKKHNLNPVMISRVKDKGKSHKGVSINTLSMS